MLEKLKPVLVEDWKRAYRFLTVQLAAILAALDYGFDYLPQVQSYIPHHWVSYVAGAIIVARFIRQSKGK